MHPLLAIPLCSISNTINCHNYVSFFIDKWSKLPDHPSPYLVQYSMKDDERVGFWEHAVVNITWLPPNSELYMKCDLHRMFFLFLDFQYNKGFMIIITSPNTKYCGPSNTFFVNKVNVPF